MLWQSTVLRRLWHRITDATERCKPLTSTKNRTARLEFAKNTKVSQKSFGTVFMDRWDKDEPLSKWWESKSVEKKGTEKDPKHTASSVKHDGGVVMAWLSLEQARSSLLMTSCMMTVAELIWKVTKPSFLPTFKKMPPDSLGIASYCIRTMTQNTLPVQSRSL